MSPRNFFLRNSIVSDPEAQAASINCLETLGLLEIDYNTYLTSDDIYAIFKRHIFYATHQNVANSARSKASGVMNCSYKKGVVTLSNMGVQFLSVCRP
ncbi:MAG: Abi-alpha family protein [Christensenellales bacterium]|jgi:hypothetical protein